MFISSDQGPVFLQYWIGVRFSLYIGWDPKMENMNAKLCFFQLVMETVMPATNNSMAETELFTYEGKKVTINIFFMHYSEFFWGGMEKKKIYQNTYFVLQPLITFGEILFSLILCVSNAVTNSDSKNIKYKIGPIANRYYSTHQFFRTGAEMNMSNMTGSSNTQQEGYG